MSQRDKFVEEMKRLTEAINKTKSRYLRADYKRALEEMKKDLIEYDKYMAEYQRSR